MAHGSILSWLNSDDLYLPGAVRKAVEAWIVPQAPYMVKDI
jgi:hypothetical protein